MEQTYKLNEEFEGSPVSIIESRLTPKVRIEILEAFKRMKSIRTAVGSEEDALNQFPELF
jgi:hypothetical protein